MSPRKRITHQDVARLAGVSTAVVSYVINNGPRPTSPEVRERVNQAIRELDYHPNAAARGLRARRTNTIGFVVNDYYAMTVFVAWYTSAMLTGLLNFLKPLGYYILVYPITIGDDLRPFAALLRSGRLDGVVLRTVQQRPAVDELLELITGAHIPCVCIEEPAAPRFGLPSVTHDNRQGAFAATQYLIAQGHRRIAHIRGDHRFGSARARYEGYQQALAAAGLPYDERLVAGTDWRHETGRACVLPMLDLANPPTAFFAANDSLALGVMQGLHARGCRVPEDAAVVGFDDSEAAILVTPALTTVRIPLDQIGQRAGELLLERIGSDQPAPASVEVLPVELVRRESA